MTIDLNFILWMALGACIVSIIPIINLLSLMINKIKPEEFDIIKISKEDLKKYDWKNNNEKIQIDINEDRIIITKVR